MKVSAAALLLIGSASAAQVQSRSLVQTSLVGIEHPVFLPQVAQATQTKNDANSSTVAQQSTVPTATSLIDTSESKFHRQTAKKTTLTIVQDFPKKAVESSAAPSMNLVQGKNSDVQFMKDGSRTTLTIVQDFPKKQSQAINNNEYVMGSKSKLDEGNSSNSSSLIITIDPTVVAQKKNEQNATTVSQTKNDTNRDPPNMAQNKIESNATSAVQHKNDTNRDPPNMVQHKNEANATSAVQHKNDTNRDPPNMAEHKKESANATVAQKKGGPNECAKQVADSISLTKNKNDTNRDPPNMAEHKKESANATTLAKHNEKEVVLTIGQEFMQKEHHNLGNSFAQNVVESFHSARSYLRQMLGFKH